MSEAQSNKVAKVCESCNKAFHVVFSESLRSPCKYCSVLCRRKRIDRVCFACGKTFWVHPSRLAQGTVLYCNIKCYRRKTLEERFWENVEKVEGCWKWKRAKTVGYGVFKHGRKMIKAHRFSWELHFGKIPDGMHVCHKCDNPECTNPGHLFLGTPKDNFDDMVKKGRRSPYAFGENHPTAKLKQHDVDEIRRLLTLGEMQSIIAKKFNVTPATISLIAKRKNWKNT